MNNKLRWKAISALIDLKQSGALYSGALDEMVTRIEKDLDPHEDYEQPSRMTSDEYKATQTSIVTLSDHLHELEETVRYLRTKARTVNAMQEKIESLQEQVKTVAGDGNGLLSTINDLHERLQALEARNKRVDDLPPP